jgi:hypothetical protein
MSEPKTPRATKRAGEGLRLIEDQLVDREMFLVKLEAVIRQEPIGPSREAAALAVQVVRGNLETEVTLLSALRAHVADRV